MRVAGGWGYVLIVDDPALSGDPGRATMKVAPTESRSGFG